MRPGFFFAVTGLTFFAGLTTFAQSQVSTSNRPVGVPSDYTSTPGGWIHPSCIHEVPNGATIEENGDVVLNKTVVAHHEPCAHVPIRTFPSKGAATVSPIPKRQTPPQGPSSYSGWVEYTSQYAPTNEVISNIYGTMDVPTNPTQNGATLYYFQSLESTVDNNCGIIQPVLQWGVSPAGGGNYWSVGAWWWSNSNQYHSGLTRHYTGEHIFFNIFKPGSGNWGICIGTTSNPQEQCITPTTSCRFNWAQPAVLEVDNGYPITSCNQLSRNVANMYNIYMSHGYPSLGLLDYSPSRIYPVLSNSQAPLCGWNIGSTNLAHSSTLWSTTLWQGSELSGCENLASGQSLVRGQSLSSCDGRFVLRMQADDGNLVLYMGTTPLWATGAVGDALVMQTDGNLVNYAGNGSVVTGGSLPSNTQGWNGAHARLQNDGNFVVYSAGNTPLWSTGTCCH